MLIHHGDKVVQEFYCRHCPADEPSSNDPEKRKTGGHFRVRFSVGYDCDIEIHCPNPKCQHVHQRHVVKGEIRDGWANGGRVKDEIKSPLSGWTRNPITRVAAEVKAANPKDNYLSQIRGGIVIKSDDDLSDAVKQARPAVPILALFNPDSENQ